MLDDSRNVKAWYNGPSNKDIIGTFLQSPLNAAIGITDKNEWTPQDNHVGRQVLCNINKGQRIIVHLIVSTSCDIAWFQDYALKLLFASQSANGNAFSLIQQGRFQRIFFVDRG
jgi:hypothetical protein